MLALAEHDGCDLCPKLGGIVLGVQEGLEALYALGRVEELLMGLDDLVDALCGEAEILRDEGGAICCEDSVGKLKIEQPVTDARRHLTGAVHEELARRLVVQEPVLDTELVVGNANRLHFWQVETVQVRSVLTGRVVPEDDPVALEPPLQVGTDRGGRLTHHLPLGRGCASGRHRTSDSSPSRHRPSR